MGTRIHERSAEGREPSLGTAILAVMRERGMTVSELGARMSSGKDRATLYRILSGHTRDPKLSTLLDICRALDVSPVEVLQLAELVPHLARDADILGIRLRQLFRRIGMLPQPLKRLAVAEAGRLTETIHEYAATPSEAETAHGEPH